MRNFTQALKIVNARLPTSPLKPLSLRVENGFFVDELSAEAEKNAATLDLQGKLLLPGLVETHIHLDKACILSRCELHAGTVHEAVEQTRRAKLAFTEQDIYQRGASVLDKAIVQGTTHMRTHVELDPQIGLQGFNAVRRLQKDYAWAITLEICVFPQEGMLNNPGTEALLRQALDQGAEVLGGCPYTDSSPLGQIERLFDMAVEYDCNLDFHLDFDLSPDNMMLPKVIEYTEKFGRQGRVTVGHVTKLSALPREQVVALGKQMALAGVSITSLPATDLFLTGRDHFHHRPRGLAPLACLDNCGVICSLSSNNIANPFTPYGDASLVRQANLFANVSQLATEAELLRCLAWISTESALLLRLKNYGLTPGCRADFVVFNAVNAAAVVAEIAPPLMGFKAGKKTFERPEATIFTPESGHDAA
ncbi:amidohydrolase [Rouxiella silvae]|uniref:Amidohydrolase n=1 Tax=Rouxiella silvae TaxID=1646373 RepID=A0ABX3TZM3_9GAMM|nr:amidohydrolase family protein [Rouxiella silvae]ORJ20688.1 amidohydrolase [Rouxiella silvae]